MKKIKKIALGIGTLLFVMYWLCVTVNWRICHGNIVRREVAMRYCNNDGNERQVMFENNGFTDHAKMWKGGVYLDDDFGMYLTDDPDLYEYLFETNNDVCVDSLFLASRGDKAAIIGYIYHNVKTMQYYYASTAEANSWWLKDDSSFLECCLSMIPFVN